MPQNRLNSLYNFIQSKSPIKDLMAKECFSTEGMTEHSEPNSGVNHEFIHSKDLDKGYMKNYYNLIINTRNPANKYFHDYENYVNNNEHVNNDLNTEDRFSHNNNDYDNNNSQPNSSYKGYGLGSMKSRYKNRVANMHKELNQTTHIHDFSVIPEKTTSNNTTAIKTSKKTFPRNNYRKTEKFNRILHNTYNNKKEPVRASKDNISIKKEFKSC